MPMVIEDWYASHSVSLSTCLILFTHPAVLWLLAITNLTLIHSYIPNWLPHFGEDGNLLPGVKLSVDCPICLRKLAITEPENENEEAFSKLPCGHAFGHECINNWLHDCIQERGKFTCPTCRVQFKHEACGHQIVLGRINTGASLSSLSLRERLGPCGPEQKVPPFCFSCRASMRESGRSETSE